jgi:hypothetical protein
MQVSNNLSELWIFQDTMINMGMGMVLLLFISQCLVPQLLGRRQQSWPSQWTLAKNTQSFADKIYFFRLFGANRWKIYR